MIYEKQKTKNISFPLGGIGTGCIALAGNGEIKDWEIFNRPNKNTRNGYSHFAIKATCSKGTVVKVLQGDTCDNLAGMPHYSFGFGPKENSLAGFPHFANHSFEGNFPIAGIAFRDADFPAAVRLCAFNPFIPHDEWNSSLPAAFFEWEIENTADETVDFSLACTVQNPAEVSVNKRVDACGAKGIFFQDAGKNDTEIGYCDLCVLADGADTAVQEYWYRGGWFDGCTTYWKNFSSLAHMPERSYGDPGKRDHGTVVSRVKVPAGEKARLRFVIAWNVPMAYNYWSPSRRDGDGGFLSWRNYYATQFKDSFATAQYAIENFDVLAHKTRQFAQALQSCTLPEAIKDAVSSNLAVIKSPVALRLADGSFWGWEGTGEASGSCCGTCQHVWNYAYAMPYLFPRLERSIREITLAYGLLEDGTTSFRVDLPLKKEMYTHFACVDGQMGEVIKCYREWKFSGDDAWLKKHAEDIFKMLEYAWSEQNPCRWDADRDGILEGRQHNTLDMELFGPNSWLEGMYLLALDCGAKMAEYLGDHERSGLYRRLYEQGKKWMDENLFNGEYFVQKIDLGDKSVVESFDAVQLYWNEEAGEIKYQAGDGCLIDQMLADWHGILIGAEDVFDPKKKKTALRSMYQYNYKASVRGFANMWRNFALDDEGGTLVCAYPEGTRVPAIPLPYCEETWTGLEYAFAGLLAAEGYTDLSERVVKTVRSRYDGEKRNPWSEIECGSNYARSMSSFALLPIYSGFSFDMTKKHIGFAPLSGRGTYLFSVCDSWGTVELGEEGCRICLLGNPLELNSISIPGGRSVTCVTVDGKKTDFQCRDGEICFDGIRIDREMVLA